MAYRPSAGRINGTNPKLVHFPPISNHDSHPLKRENTIPTSRKYHRSFFEVFPFLKTKRHERPALLQLDPDPPQKKAPLKPIIQRHAPSEMESSVEASPYNWPHDGSFDPKTTALVIIDMQKDCTFEQQFQSSSQIMSGFSFSTPTFVCNFASLPSSIHVIALPAHC